MRRVFRYSDTLFLTGIIIPAVLMACAFQSSNIFLAASIQPSDHKNNHLTIMQPTLEALSNMTYAGIYENAITLKNGRWAGEPYDGRWAGEPYVNGGKSRPLAGIVKDFLLTADINGNGSKEVAAILTESTGGSGSRSYVVIVDRRKCDSKRVSLGIALIGDRVQLQNGRIEDGKIVLELIQQGVNDAACCPSQKARRSWTLDENGLTEEEVQMTGILSLADIAGKTWVLTQLKKNESRPMPPVITLNIDNKHAAGISACNRYFANVTSSAIPGDLAVCQIGGTQATCPDKVMDLENSYLEALGNVFRYSFQAGKLALTWRKDEAVNTMLFVSGEHQQEF